MSLAPKLQTITIDPSRLLLDPNNPRLFTREEEKVPLSRIPDPGFQDTTAARIDSPEDRFKINELVGSIQTNSYIPEAGGYMFVRKLPDSEYYVVLEGNRRLIAIRKLLRNKDKLRHEAPNVLNSLMQIDVLEIIDDLPEDEIQKKISYLLGTCHHGSHKDWSPFAQARGIYNRYIRLTGQNDNNFNYDPVNGQNIASLLSIKEKEVRERLLVYRAMQQLAAEPQMQALPNGGIIDNYYSLIGEAVCSKKIKIKEYIPKDPNTFTLEHIAIERLMNLCNFDGTKKRGYIDQNGERKAPAMNNPRQWSYLDKILNDPQRDENLKLVEEEHQHPEEVWARRWDELREFTWKKWLEAVNGILSDVRMIEDFETEDAKMAIREVYNIILNLGEDKEVK